MAGYGKARDLLAGLFVPPWPAATVASFRCKKSGGAKTPPARERRRPTLYNLTKHV